MDHERFHVTCPQRIRADARKDALEELWATPEWKGESDEFIRRNPLCAYCGNPSEVPHHNVKADYDDRKRYISLDTATPVCHICHGGIHSGKFRCPVCGRINAKSEGEPCYLCLTDGDKERIREAKQRRNRQRNALNRERRIRARTMTKCNYCDKEATGKFTLEANPKRKRPKDTLVHVCKDHENEAMGRTITPLSAAKFDPKKHLTGTVKKEKAAKISPKGLNRLKKIEGEGEFVPLEQAGKELGIKTSQKKSPEAPADGHKHRWINYGGHGMQDGKPTRAWVCNVCGKREDLPEGEVPKP